VCINPKVHPNGLRTPCHQCWQCRENRINDWSGRCIAEKESSLAATVVTLTYGGGDTPESRFLRKSDITAYIKALRNAGHVVRYFAVGEYGSKKGRAHWHALLFWNSKMPAVEFRKNVSDPYWPHGFVMHDEADAAGVRYVMKYINKDSADGSALKAVAMSRKPMLGSEYFRELAARYVAQGLSPQKPFYKFIDVRDQHGNVRVFYMPPLVQERFIGFYIEEWTKQRPGKHWPSSDLVDKFHDKLVAYLPPLRLEKRQMREGPWMLPPDGSKERFDEKLNLFYVDVAGERLYWSFDEQGRRAWRNAIVTETQAAQLRHAASLRGAGSE